MNSIFNKECRRCKKIKSINLFGKRKIAKDGLKSWCNQCCCEDMKNRRLSDPVRYKEIEYRSIIKRTSKRKEEIKNWRKRNQEHIREYRKQYRQKNEIRDCRKIESAKYRRKKGIPIQSKISKEEELRRANNSSKKYYKVNKQGILKYKKIWAKKKRQTDIQFRLKNNLRKRIWDALKGNTKSAKTIDLMGCSIKELIISLESLFTGEMSWNNYGDWHIDHIIPCALFDLQDKNQQKQCFNFLNLQPLWAKDNMSKGRKLA